MLLNVRACPCGVNFTIRTITLKCTYNGYNVIENRADEGLVYRSEQEKIFLYVYKSLLLYTIYYRNHKKQNIG